MRAGWFTTALIVLAAVSGAAHADRPSGTVDQVPTRALAGWSETGQASWYGRVDHFHGKPTASGVVFDTFAPMCAHKSLRFGTTALVSNLENGRRTWCVVRDRGPFVAGRIIDLSEYSAGKIGMLRQGTAWVRVEALR